MTFTEWRKDTLMMTKRELALALGVSPALITMIEHGNAKISTKMRGNIKKLYGTAIAKELV